MPSIGRGQILTSEDAPARIDAGIELDLGLGSSGSPEKKRAWPEEPDSVHNKAGVHRSQPGDGSSAPGESDKASGICATYCHGVATWPGHHIHLLFQLVICLNFHRQGKPAVRIRCTVAA